MRTVSSLFESTFIFKVLCVAALALFSIVIQLQVTHAASAVSYSTGYSGYSDPCPSSDSYKSSAASYNRNCSNEGSGDSYGSSVTSKSSGYSYYNYDTDRDNTSESGKSAVKSEIQSLLDRIKALNEQIKTGIAPKSKEQDSSNNKEKKNVTDREAPQCKALKTGLAFGSSDNGIGGDVSQLQKTLIHSGHFKGEATGYFGTQTREAVRSFQKEHGIASSGDEETTGFGRIGEKTTALLARKCMKDETLELPVKEYTLEDVSTVTYRTYTGVPFKKFKLQQLNYEVKLKDETKLHFSTRTGSIATVNDSVIEAVKKTGYTGDVKALLDKATEALASSKAPKKFILDDVSTITAKAVDPSTTIADDEYTVYSITFKTGAVIEVKGHVGRGTEFTRGAPFRKVGYRGDLEELLAKVVTPVVLGATTSIPEGILLEIEEKLTALQLFFMKD